jgi:hypothetical protein
MTDDEIKSVSRPDREKLAKRADCGHRNRIARAKRYEIGAMMRFRIRGEKEWHEGVMKNISNSGVLFRTTYSLSPDAVIEMTFVLPVQLQGESAAEVFCRGSVVRLSQSEVPGEAVPVAARIDHSRFLRQNKESQGSAKFLSIDGGRRKG